MLDGNSLGEVGGKVFRRFVGKLVGVKVGVVVFVRVRKLLCALDGDLVDNSVGEVDGIAVGIIGPPQLPQVTLQRICICSRSVVSGEQQ